MADSLTKSLQKQWLLEVDNRTQMKTIKTSLYLATLLIALSCDPIAAANFKTTPTTTTSNQVAPLSHQQILTHLMIGEMALQRDMPETALEQFMLVAKATKDPEVAQLATELAIQLQSIDDALTASEIWANAAPNDVQAQLVAVTLFVNSNPNKAQKFLLNAFNTHTADIDQHVLIILSKLSEKGQKNLTEIVEGAAANKPDNADIQLTAAQVAAVQLNIDSAKKYLAKAFKIKPDLTNGIQLQAKLIRYEKNDDKPALDYLAQQVDKYPKNNDLRMFYVIALTDNSMYQQAIPQLEILSKDGTYGGDALIMLGETYIIQNKFSQAENVIKKALKFESSTDKASYYLGQLSEYDNKNAEAISWYENVSEESEFHVPAYLRAAYLHSVSGDYSKALSTLQNSSPSTFSDQKQILLTEIDVLIDAKEYDQALDNTNSALQVLDDDVDFLYARSVIYGLMQKNTEAEKDLRKILEMDPNNANALNALGFTLANQPNRLQEAMPLLEKALSLNPDNPAFMDSMGWLLFKMGKTEEAVEMLTEAYKMSGDNEIAAHLGEVLWSMGKKEAAKEVWKKALIASPVNHEAIKNTLTRLNIPVSEFKVAPVKTNTTIPSQKATN